MYGWPMQNCLIWSVIEDLAESTSKRMKEIEER